MSEKSLGFVFYDALCRHEGYGATYAEKYWDANPSRQGYEAGAQAVAEEVMRHGTTRSRSVRQAQVYAWCRLAFGEEHANSLHQRGLRLLEEAIEAYQAAGGAADMAHRLVDHVFSNPVGALNQELGGVGVTLLALAAAASLSADEEEDREVDRVLSKPLEHFRKRNEAKNAAGFNVVGPSIAAPGLDPDQVQMLLSGQTPAGARGISADDIAAADRLLRDENK